MSANEDQIRAALFAHLDELLAHSPDGTLKRSDVNTLLVEGRPLTPMTQPGIRNVKGIQAALCFTTTIDDPYADRDGPDGLLRYKYQGHDPQNSFNRSMRAAMLGDKPLVYFKAIASGVYVAHYPVYIVDDDPSALEFTVSSVNLGAGREWSDLERRYAARIVQQRIHQRQFSASVFRAYGGACTMCNLHHRVLLDAAHIIEDSDERGDPVVSNGLLLCKIHHAAFDKNILGVRPRDRRIEVREDILAERDGPMLEHGLQRLDGSHLLNVPSGRQRPDPDRLEIRYDRFLQAS